MIALGPRLWWLVTGLTPVGALVAQWRQNWIEGVIVAVALTLIAVVFDFLRTQPAARIGVERDCPPSVVMNADSELRWTIANRGSRPAMVSIADELAPSLGAQRRASTTVPPGAIAVVKVPFQPARRGLFSVNRFTVRVHGPWKLVSRQADREIAAELRVVPVFRSRREVELRLHRARLLEVGARSVRSRGGGTEFDHLREYSVDDSYRHIDWAATARIGHPIVRSYRAEQHQTVVVLLDNGRMMAAKSDGVTRLEHGMDAVMALATVSSRIGDRLGLVTFDLNPHRIVAPGRGRRHMGALTETMFALEPRLSESDYDRLAATVLARFRRRMMVVLLTDLVGPVVDSSIAPAVAALAKRHQVVVGAVTNSEVAGWSRRSPTDGEHAYLTGAAVISTEDRARAARTLVSAGAAVIDVEAGRLGPELVDHYLEAKARNR